jgi:hypothetical protein
MIAIRYSYSDAQTRRIFRDIVDIPATVSADGDNVIVNLHRRAQLPLILASGLLDNPVEVPWWSNKKLILTSTTARSTDSYVPPVESDFIDPSSEQA